MIRAFHDLGSKFQPGTRFSTALIAKELGIIDRHRRLFGRMLDILAEEGVLRKVESDWEVIIAPQEMNPSEHLRLLLDRYLPAEAELTLLGRCGSRLVPALRGSATL